MLRIAPILLLVMVLLAAPLSAQELVYDPAVCADDTSGAPLSDACAQLIEAFPRPANLEEIDQDRSTLGTYSFWRVGPEPVNTYDAPNAGPTGQIPQGFNFVTATDLTVDGWLQIEGGRWLRRDDARFTAPSLFTGVEITDGLEHPFAWVLDLSQIAVSTEPGGEWANETGRFLRRYERVNIYATAFDEEGWRWYMIGPNHWVKQTFVSKVQRIRKPEGASERWVAVDLYEQTLVAYEGDTPVFATLISSGLPGTETREGMFNIWARLPVDPMSGATGAPNAYALQTVPWVLYFDEGISLHGTYWHDLFGYRQSRGCVNLTVSDARWIYEWTQASGQNDPETGDPFVNVYVHSSGVYGEPAGLPEGLTPEDVAPEVITIS